MMSKIMRWTRRLLSDPTLRLWLLRTTLGRDARPSAFQPHRPPYLGDVVLPEPGAIASDGMGMAAARQRDPIRPSAPMVISLAGRNVVLDPADAEGIFALSFADTEQLLAFHRFAWIPLLGTGIDADWVDILWRGWCRRYATPTGDWAWHPYTAAERAINIIDFSRRYGLPGDKATSLAILASHAEPIIACLEYFGDHDTSNHLSNNGRGLYRLGLALDSAQIAAIGHRILLEEAQRIFRPSGVLREGSAHYHVLLARNYVDAWLAARRHNRPEADALKAIARKALDVIPGLMLPGGLPLIGDISPDCPPDFLAGLLPGGALDHGWCALPDETDRRALRELMSGVRGVADDALMDDGWIRLARGSWSGLWRVPPDGWVPMPGHGHYDIGSFELHWGAEPVFVDPGRGAYGEDGEAGFYVSAAAHNSLTIDDHEPSPPNKPYYDPAFRRRIYGPPPRVLRGDGRLSVEYGGYGRLPGVGSVERTFAFSDRALVISDRVDGRSPRVVKRRLHTSLDVKRDGAGLLLVGTTADFRVYADRPIEIAQAKRWLSYGVSVPSAVLTIAGEESLPCALSLTVEKIDR